ncbi:MAG: hypothetical protein EXR62_15090, partial [Chloroflexi bacterium]|nr:hypothetical protein [Chloroflexota bacterium]
MDKCRFAIWLWVVFSLTGLGQAWWDGRSDSTGGRLAILPQINQAFGQIRGQVTLQGRSYHDSVSIWLDETRFTGTGADGIFGFSQVVPGVHQLRAERGGFLCSQVTVTVGSGQLLTLNATLLRAGDANRDGRVNLLDLVLVGGYFRGQPPANPWADVNGDGIVDLLDLILVGGNYGLACPMPWTVLIETPTATPLPATRTPTVTSTPLATATSSATPTPRPVTMTPTVMRTPLATATSSATPTPRPVTMTPTVTQTPQPPATFTPISTPIPG